MSATDRERVLVTGSSGLLGARISRRLAKRFEVVGMDLDEPGDDWGGDAWIHADLTDDASTRTALDRLAEGSRSLASVIHLAAYYDFSGEPSPLYDALTVEGTRRLLRGLSDFEVSQFVFSSSLLVMAPAQPGELIDETSPTTAEWAYPESKLAAERVLSNERGDINTVVLRIAGIYDEDCRSIPIGQQIRRIHERDLESVFFPGNPEHGQPFLHREDLVDCVDRIVDARERLGPEALYLVAEPTIVPYGELQDRLGELIHGRSWPTIRIPAPLAKAGAWLKDKLGDDAFIKPWMIDLADAHYPVSIDRVCTALDWRPHRSLAGVLPEMVRRLKDDPAAWKKRNGFSVQ